MTEVLTARIQSDRQHYLTPSLRRSSLAQPSVAVGSAAACLPSVKPRYAAEEHDTDPYVFPVPISAPPSPKFLQTDFPLAYQPVCVPGCCADTRHDDQAELSFPSYNDMGYLDQNEDLEPPPSPRTDNSYTVPSSGTTLCTASPESELVPVAEDDTAVRPTPSRHVDYLSHDWREEDIWASWKHIVSNRRLYGERSRLENASWRTWTKFKNRLSTVSPETLNWLKDCDVTWLYGPLQTRSYFRSHVISEPVSTISKSNSFLNKKPILKKRSASEVMLQKSISASSLLKQATASIQAQQNVKRPGLSRELSLIQCPSTDHTWSKSTSKSTSRDLLCYSSQSTSGLQSPDGERKHIRFDDKVEQCIAVEIKDMEEEGYDYDDDEDGMGCVWSEDEISEDEMVIMKGSKPKEPVARQRSRSNSTSEGRTIAKLPSTTLKYRTDTPDAADGERVTTGLWGNKTLSPSPSQETLRPNRSRQSFNIDEDEVDMPWEPSGAFVARNDGGPILHSTNATAVNNAGHSRLTNDGDMDYESSLSGIYLPYEDEEDETVSLGLFGRVVDTVNTARDIAHVILNVGWRK